MGDLYSNPSGFRGFLHPKCNRLVLVSIEPHTLPLGNNGVSPGVKSDGTWT